jgi:hypothetical protein
VQTQALPVFFMKIVGKVFARQPFWRAQKDPPQACWLALAGIQI